MPETVAAHRWRAEVYDRVMAMVPADLATGWTRPRSSTRSSSTGGSCPSRRAGRRHHGRRAGLLRRVLPEVPEDLVTPVSAMTERDGIDDPDATAPDCDEDPSRRRRCALSSVRCAGPPAALSVRPRSASCPSSPIRRTTAAARRGAGRGPGSCSPSPSAVLLVDLVSKLVVVATIAPGEDIRVLGGLLYLTQLRNIGAAFSFAEGATVRVQPDRRRRSPSSSCGRRAGCTRPAGRSRSAWSSAARWAT